MKFLSLYKTHRYYSTIVLFIVFITKLQHYSNVKNIVHTNHICFVYTKIKGNKMKIETKEVIETYTEATLSVKEARIINDAIELGLGSLYSCAAYSYEGFKEYNKSYSPKAISHYSKSKSEEAEHLNLVLSIFTPRDVSIDLMLMCTKEVRDNNEDCINDKEKKQFQKSLKSIALLRDLEKNNVTQFTVTNK